MSRRSRRLEWAQNDKVQRPWAASSSTSVRKLLARRSILDQRIKECDREAKLVERMCQLESWNLGDLGPYAEYEDEVAPGITYGDLFDMGLENDADAREKRDAHLERIAKDKAKLQKQIQQIDKDLKRLEKQCYMKM
jgi:hypothetical protein